MRDSGGWGEHKPTSWHFPAQRAFIKLEILALCPGPAHLALLTATSADRGQNYIFPCNSGVNWQMNIGKKRDASMPLPHSPCPAIPGMFTRCGLTVRACLVHPWLWTHTQPNIYRGWWQARQEMCVRGFLRPSCHQFNFVLRWSVGHYNILAC